MVGAGEEGDNLSVAVAVDAPLCTSWSEARHHFRLSGGRFGRQSKAVQDCVDDPSLQHQGELGGSAANCTGRRPIDSGRGCRFGFWGALVTMRVRGASENMRGGQGHAARQKMQEQRFFISTSACGRSFSIRQGICRSHE